jgi:hypothetical protein
VDLQAPARVEWIIDGQQQSARTCDTGFGLHVATLPLAPVGSGERVSVDVQPDSDELKPDSFVVHIR